MLRIRCLIIPFDILLGPVEVSLQCEGANCSSRMKNGAFYIFELRYEKSATSALSDVMSLLILQMQVVGSTNIILIFYVSSSTLCHLCL